MDKKAFIISFVMLLVSLIAVSAIALRKAPVVVETNLERLPMVIAGYTATEDSFSDFVYKVLNADKHIYRHYLSKDGEQIDMYIGYYGTAKGGRTGHNPYACLPGGGAAIIDTGKVAIAIPSTGKTVPVNFILSKKNEINTVMLHWYQTAGNKVVSTGIRQNIERFVGRVMHNRNDGAFVQITSTSSDKDVLNTKKKLINFAEKLQSELPRYWPVEK